MSVFIRRRKKTRSGHSAKSEDGELEKSPVSPASTPLPVVMLNGCAANNAIVEIHPTRDDQHSPGVDDEDYLEVSPPYTSASREPKYCNIPMQPESAVRESVASNEYYNSPTLPASSAHGAEREETDDDYYLNPVLPADATVGGKPEPIYGNDAAQPAASLVRDSLVSDTSEPDYYNNPIQDSDSSEDDYYNNPAQPVSRGHQR